MTDRDDDAGMNGIDRDAADWLARLRAGGSGEQRAFEEWYSADPANADAYDRVLASWEAMDGLVDPSSVPARPRRAWGYAAAAIAAVLLLCVGVGVIYRPAGPASASSFAMATNVGELRTVALSDGTKVTLDTQSAIRATFDASRRQVQLLRGRAHFDVASDTRPFVVATATGSLSSGGATFDVAYDGSETRVGVVRGAADVQSIPRHGAAIRIAPGSALVLNRDGRIGGLTTFFAADVRWTAGMLSFEDAPLATVIAAANRYSARQIVLDDPAIGALRFTGTFKAKDLSGLAQMVAAMFNLNLDSSDPLKFVLSR